jgi:hypothetical protein
MKTQRFFAFFTAILITYFLTWGIIACAQIGLPPELTHAAARTQAAIGAPSVIL